MVPATVHFRIPAKVAAEAGSQPIPQRPTTALASAISCSSNTVYFVGYLLEQEIADAKAVIGRCGIGCEPASAATLAGIRN